MSRQLKFRGKRVYSDKWVYGYYAELVENGEHFYWINEPNGDSTDVIPETVGQYTGLKDKNGKEIYEGDIITTDLERNYLIVEYRNGAFMLNCNDGEEDYYDIFFSTYEEPTEVYKYGEVIGNIYDSPELMGVKNERD